VVRHGRTFTQFLRDLLAAHERLILIRNPSAITIDGNSRDDIAWWIDFMQQWNGISLLWDLEWMDSSSQIQPHTDACVSGYGAVCGSSWFHGRWSSELESLAQEGTHSRDSMPWKELYAIVVAACTWGHLWQRKKVVFFSDCLPVVQALEKGSSRTRGIMQLIRILHHQAAKHSFHYRIKHIPGVENTIADELSRVHVMSQLSMECRRAIDPTPTMPVHPPIQSL
jgi:hypothetical protein